MELSHRQERGRKRRIYSPAATDKHRAKQKVEKVFRFKGREKTFRQYHHRSHVQLTAFFLNCFIYFSIFLCIVWQTKIFRSRLSINKTKIWKAISYPRIKLLYIEKLVILFLWNFFFVVLHPQRLFENAYETHSSLDTHTDRMACAKIWNREKIETDERKKISNAK